MFKIGIDAVDINRIEKSLKKGNFKEKVFTENEITHCHTPQNYAGIFAAKEAFFKASGSGIKIPINQVEVNYSESGQPTLNQKNSSVSITHEGNLAIAVVIIWD